MQSCFEKRNHSMYIGGWVFGGVGEPGLYVFGSHFRSTMKSCNLLSLLPLIDFRGKWQQPFSQFPRADSEERKKKKRVVRGGQGKTTKYPRICMYGSRTCRCLSSVEFPRSTTLFLPLSKKMKGPHECCISHLLGGEELIDPRVSLNKRGGKAARQPAATFATYLAKDM